MQSIKPDIILHNGRKFLVKYSNVGSEVIYAEDLGMISSSELNEYFNLLSSWEDEQLIISNLADQIELEINKAIEE